MNNVFKIAFISLLFVLLSVGCNKQVNHPVPNIPFDVTIDFTLPSYSNLTGVGGYAYVNAGSRGVIVYRRGLNDFVAFDRHSPADVDGSCPTALTPDSNNYLILNDACNEAQFSLYDGSPMSGSDFGLRAYQTVFDGNNSLRIYN